MTTTSDTTDRLPGLHALRVAAAVSVYAGHALFWSRDWVYLPDISISGYLVLGLQLFFVVSAFSLMHSTQVYKSAPDWRTTFYLKRFWRIAPLFYVMMIVTAVFTHMLDGRVPSVLEVVLNLFFVNNLSPQYASSLVFAGWSVSVEMLFYAIFPLIFAHVRTLGAGVILAIAGILISQVSRILVFEHIQQPIGTYGDNAFPVMFQYFCMGVLAYLVFERLKRSRLGAPMPAATALFYHAIFAAVTGAIIAIVVAFHEPLNALGRTDLTLCGLMFAVVTVWFSLLRIPALNWAPIQYFGERSYSLYLLHILLIFLLRPLIVYVYEAFEGTLGVNAIVPAMIAAYVPIMAASAVTYALIEKPGMDFGRKLRKGLKRKAKPEPQPVSG